MSISEKLAKIQKRAALLNGKTDTFNATIEYTERALRKSGAGIEFWWGSGPKLGLDIRNSTAEHPKERVYHILGFSKLGAEWHICVKQLHDINTDARDPNDWDQFDDSEAVPLARASRQLRAEAAEHLEQFLEAIYDELGRMEQRIDTANAIVSAEIEAEAKK